MREKRTGILVAYSPGLVASPGSTAAEATSPRTRRVRRAAVLLAGLLALFVAVAPAAVAQEDEEAMFGGPVVTEDDEGGDGAAESTEDFSAAMLESEETIIGGRYRFAMTPKMTWDGLESPEDISGQGDYGFDTQLSAQLFLDARPSADFRVYGEADITYPFTVSEGTGVNAPRDFDDIVTISELFSDITVGDRLFLRGGKHTVTWGVGYFFSPADIINLERIDPEDPEADREGPVNLRGQVPLGTTNFYLYGLPPVGSEEFGALAPKAEVVLGTFELGAGAFWRYEDDPAAMVTLEGTVSDWSFFGEGVFLGSSDRRYIREVTPTPTNPAGLEVSTREEPVWSATGGASYRYSPVESDTMFFATGQYLYNGAGYEDPQVLSANREGVALLLAAGELGPSDLVQPGRHYAAVSGSVRSILGSELSVQSLWYGNLADASGQVSATLSYRFTDYLSASSSAAYRYGEPGDEFTVDGQALALELRLDVGSGRF